MCLLRGWAGWGAAARCSALARTHRGDPSEPVFVWGRPGGHGLWLVQALVCIDLIWQQQLCTGCGLFAVHGQTPQAGRQEGRKAARTERQMDGRSGLLSSDTRAHGHQPPIIPPLAASPSRRTARSAAGTGIPFSFFPENIRFSRRQPRPTRRRRDNHASSLEKSRTLLSRRCGALTLFFSTRHLFKHTISFSSRSSRSRGENLSQGGTILPSKRSACATDFSCRLHVLLGPPPRIATPFPRLPF